MEKFFYPESIVFIGVSLNKMSLGKVALVNNINRGFKGKLYGIGSEEGELLGAPVYKDIANIPETPDVAVILTPAGTVPELMESCGEKGIKRIVIETGGFSEYSNKVNELEVKVLEIAKKYKMKVIGPNCVGASNAETGMMNAFGFFKREEKESNIGIISQSGGIGNTFMRIVNDNHLFWNKFVSIGNKLDLDEVDFIDYFLKDKNIGVISMYLESFKRGREFFNLAMSSNKPFILFKSNRSEKSAKIAQSHTTALSASDDIVDAAMDQAAVTRVEGEDELAIAFKAFKLPAIKGKRVAVLSRSGGHAVITADACAKYDLDMIEFSDEYINNLKSIYKTRVISHQNPLDLGEIFDYTIFIKIVEETLKLENVDGIIFNHLYQPSYEAESSRSFLDAVDKLVEKYNKPVYVSLTSNAEEITDISINHPFPTFGTPLQAAIAFNMSLNYFKQKKARDNTGSVNEYSVDLSKIESIKKRCNNEQRIPLTDEALEICSLAEIKTVKYVDVKSVEEIDEIDFNFPVAVKLLSKDASHKSDVGGVALNLNSKEETKNAVENMKEKLYALSNKPEVDGFLIQEMALQGEEFFVGGRRDPSFGPIVMVGFGGIYIEVINDRSIRLAPVTENVARDMIEKLKMFPVIKGNRGKKPLDADALIQLICKVSNLLCKVEYIQEIDLNPVIVHPENGGVSIVDSRIFFN